MDIGGLILGVGLIGMAFLAVGLGLTRRGAAPAKPLTRIVALLIGLLLLGTSYYFYDRDRPPPGASFELRATPAPGD